MKEMNAEWGKKENQIKINSFTLARTCFACPEQYDVLKGKKQVGYLRLRWGEFEASVPDCGGKVVYLAEPKGDGIFEDDERLHYLTEALKAIAKA